MLRRALISAWFLLLASACSASLPVGELSTPLATGPLRLEPGYDLCFMRIDLRRQYRTETTTYVDATGRPIMRTRSVPVPYHYLGVDLGNGLFLDANLNLALDVLRLRHLDAVRSFSVERQRRSFYPVSADSSCRRNESHLVAEAHGFFGSSQTAELGEREIVLSGGFLSSEQRIEIQPDGLVYDPDGIFGSWMRTEIRRTGDGVSLSTATHLRLEEDAIWLGNGILVRREEDSLVFPAASNWLTGTGTPTRLSYAPGSITATEGEDWKLRVEVPSENQLTARRAGLIFDSVSDFFVNSY